MSKTMMMKAERYILLCVRGACLRIVWIQNKYGDLGLCRT